MGEGIAEDAQIFKSFDDDEKKWWHSHAYEVSSGMLMLGVRDAVGLELERLQADLAHRPRISCQVRF